MRALCLSFAWILIGTSPLTALEIRPFPLTVVESGEELVMRASLDEMASLESLDEVLLTEVALPGGRVVDLNLARVEVTKRPCALMVDHERISFRIDDEVSVWSGKIVGEDDSEAYLTLSPHGSWGWIDSSSEGMVHLMSQRGPNGWKDGTSRFVTDEAIRLERGDPDLGAYCQADQLPTIRDTSANNELDTKTNQRPSGGPLPLLELHLALETDYQYYQIFNDLDAARVYTVSLLGAVGIRYRDQVGLIISTIYMQFYTSNSDPWDEQDSGGNCIDVLYEFQGAWKNGGGPVTADLYHMLSGASLGCGVAWLDVLCDQEYGFSVSGNMNGNLDFPVVQGPNNWDFMVFAHEIGHNVGTPHTHDYCPPLDECAPSGYWGSCQDETDCISDGTIMSYCHLCSGGVGNITTWFHPVAADHMRTDAENSCLQPFEGVLTTDLGYSLDGSQGTPTMDVGYTDGPDTIDIFVESAPLSTLGLLIGSPTTSYAPFLGGTLVPALDVLVLIQTSGTGTFAASAPAGGGSYPNGVILYAHAFFLDPGGLNGYAATNAVEIELIRP